GDGLFICDTRILSLFRLTMRGRPIPPLSASLSHDNVFFTANLSNAGGEEGVPHGVIHVERRRFLWKNRFYERITLTNYWHAPATIPLRLEFAADFRDMFEVRGAPRPRRGNFGTPVLGGDGVTYHYDGLDGVSRRSAVAFSPPPEKLDSGSADF